MIPQPDRAPTILPVPEPAPSAPYAPTVRQVVDEFLATAKETGRYSSRASYDNRAAVLHRLCDHAGPDGKSLGGKLVAHCRGSDLEKWLARQTGWKSDWSKRGALQTVQACFNWAASPRERLIAENPFAGISHCEGERGQLVPDDALRRLLRASDALYRRVLLFQSETGCRPCEMSQLQWEPGEWGFLDLNGGRAILRRHKASHLQKRRRPRVIQLSALAVRLLRWLQRQRPLYGEPTHVFLNARGNPWKKNALSSRFKRLRKSLGLPATLKLYGLRHRYGTLQIVRGSDSKTVADLMGNSPAIVEKHYVDLFAESDPEVFSHLRNANERTSRARPAT
jgi:integrase